MNIDNQMAHDINTIVNHFKRFFTNVAADSVKIFPTTKGLHNTNSNFWQFFVEVE